MSWNAAPPHCCEVSSANVVPRWVRLRPRSFAALFFEPTIPFAEYDRQMERLLAIITVRTGLPLYGLR